MIALSPAIMHSRRCCPTDPCLAVKSALSIQRLAHLDMRPNYTGSCPKITPQFVKTGKIFKISRWIACLRKQRAPVVYSRRSSQAGSLPGVLRRVFDDKRFGAGLLAHYARQHDGV